MFFEISPSPDELPTSISAIYKNLQSTGNSYLTRFHILLNKNPIDEALIINYLIKTPDILMLVKLSLADKDLGNWCEDERMTLMWNEVWRCMDKNPTFQEAQNNKSLTYRGLRSQLNISSYRLVCGLILFKEAQQLVDNGYDIDSEPVMELLIQAINFGSYDALNALSNINIENLFKEKFEIPEIILAPLLKAAPLHGAPIYLLCALNCYFIAIYHSNYKKTIESQQAYQYALQYLYAADLCEEASENEIYNAYRQEGIKASNLWEINNIPQLIEKLIEVSDLNSIAKSIARTSADKIAQIFLKLQQKNITPKIVM